MNPRLVEIGIPALVGALGAVAVGWLVFSTTKTPSVPDRPLLAELAAKQADEVAAQNEARRKAVPPSTPATLTTATANPAAAPVQEWPGSWPGFRGPNGDNVSPEAVALLDSWPTEGPPRVYSIAMGEGYASPAVLNSRFFVLDYDRDNRSDVLRCFNLTTGTEIWRNSYPVIVKRNHGMSRTVPATDGKFVVTLGPKCHVLCADFASGKTVWFKDLVAEFGTVVPEWYAGQCPILDGDKAIVAPGGKALMVAFDLKSGKEVWRTPNPRNWQMTHSSILPLEIEGTKMYVYCGSGGITGVSAQTGQILWDNTDWVINTATVPTPVPIGGGKLFLTGGYNAGSMMLQISQSGGKWTSKEVFRLKPTEFGSDQQTPIFYKGHIYGVIPGGQLVCLTPDGKRKWASGSKRRFGLGAYAIADGKIFLLDDHGQLTMVSASPDSYTEMATAKVLQGPDAWGPIAFAGGLMLVRDQNELLCLHVAKR